MLYIWFMVMPVTFNLMSPVLIIFAGFATVINMSFIIFGLWFLSSFIFGRAYCSISCQWGAIQEIYGILVPKKLHKNRKMYYQYVKYVVFAVWIVFVFLGPLMAGGYIGVNIVFPNSPGETGSWASFDATVAMQMIFYFGIQAFIVFFFTLMQGSRSFCRYYCPMGVLGAVGTKIKNWLKYPSLHLEAESEKCIKCGKCSKNCPMGLDVKEMVLAEDMRSVDCILCGECVSNCPKEVISYAWKWKVKK